MKIEWKKDEKALYLPKTSPELVRIPAFNFFVIEGRGNPNEPEFSDHVGVLYSLAYGVKMSPKAGIAPAGYFDYTVYPLEGVWDISEEAKNDFRGKLDKDSLVYRLMIRQPDFVDEAFASLVVERARKKTPNPLYDAARFERLEEGDCVQMTHIGSYDDEPASFAAMEAFAAAAGLARTSRRHREIYLSDPRRIAPEKRKTVLRFQVVRA
ncbi:MAG TPA: GyrI-like domain-containing protein [Rectinemataceae bacterium]|nr:GyrI-like domain-containing protein [Rectinemataceae bacterium]